MIRLKLLVTKFNHIKSWRIWANINQLQILARVLTFDSLLACVPALAVAFALFNYFGGFLHLAPKLDTWLFDNMTESRALRDFVRVYLEKFIHNAQGDRLDVLSMILLAFTVISLLTRIEESFNAIFKTEVQRSPFKRLMVYSLALIACPFLLGLSLALNTALKTSYIVKHINIFNDLYKMMLPAMPFVLNTLGFTLLFKLMPHTRILWKSAIVTAILTTLCWQITQHGFAIYAKANVTLHVIYGKLVVIPLFILWQFVSWLLILLGAQTTAFFNQRWSHKNP